MYMPIKFPNESTYVFDPDNFVDAKGRLKAILVFKKTRWDLQDEGDHHYSSYIDELDREDMLSGHKEHLKALEQIRSILRENKVVFLECFRSDLTKKLTENRLVITVGGDGTLLETAQLVVDSPLLGVNSDPDRSVGSLCVATAETFGKLVSQIINRQALVQKVIRINCTIDGNAVAYSALNEILIAHENPAAVSRYTIIIDETVESQKSSGIWIGAPAGSSGAIVSAGGFVQAIYDEQLQLVVREPYFAKPNSLTLLSLLFDCEKKITIISQMRDGKIYFDGPFNKIPFSLGMRLEVSGKGKPLHLFVSPEAEQQRQQIGKYREVFQRQKYNLTN